MSRRKSSPEIVLILAFIILIELLFVIPALRNSSKPVSSGLPPTSLPISELGISECIRILESATNIELKTKVIRQLPKFEGQATVAIPCLLDIIENKSGRHEDLRLMGEAIDVLAMLRGEGVMKELVMQLSRADDIRAAEHLIPYTNKESPALPVLHVQLNRTSSDGRAVPAVNSSTRKYAERLYELAASMKTQEYQRRLSLEQLGDLGSAATGVVERITSMLNPALTEGSAIAATRATTAELSQREVITTLGQIGPGAQSAVPKLLPFLTNTSVGLRLYSARALWQITGDPKPVVPVLRQIIEEEGRYDPTFVYVLNLGLSNSFPLRGRAIQLPRSVEGVHLGLQWAAAYLLGEIGKPAEPALPALRRMLGNIEDFPCNEALFTLRAISKVTGDNSTFLSLLLKHLNSDSREAQSVRVPVIHFLIEFGAAARPALDRLEVLSTSKESKVAFAATCAIEWIRGPTPGKEPQVL